MNRGISANLVKVGNKLMHLKAYLQVLSDEFNESFAEIAIRAQGEDFWQNIQALEASILYSVKNGGKRFRPILLLAILEAFNVPRHKGKQVAVALEMIHTYSLIHDDLPAMDNDDFRRGVLTNHKVHGEAMAILAGDGLLTDAFAVIASDWQLADSTKVKLISELARAAGTCGMIAGQALDLQAETQTITIAELTQMHLLKTGCLLEFACLAAGIIAGQDEAVVRKLGNFGQSLGLAFQIKDDILDVEGEQAKLGKTVGSDVANQKSTYVSLLGLAKAKAMLAKEITQALKLLADLPAEVNRLKELTQYVGNRDR